MSNAVTNKWATAREAARELTRTAIDHREDEGAQLSGMSSAILCRIWDILRGGTHIVASVVGDVDES